MTTLKMERVYTDDGSELTAAGFSTSIANPKNFQYDGRYMWVTSPQGVGVYEFWGESSDHEPAWETLDELVYPRYDTGLKKKLKLVTFIQVGASQLKRATRYPALSLRPEILDTTPDGSTTVSGFTVTLTTKSDGVKVITEVGTNALGVALVPHWICKVGAKMYIAAEEFDKLFEFDVETQRLIQIVNLPFRTGSTRQVGKSNLLSAGGKVWFISKFYNDDYPQRMYTYTPGDTDMTVQTIPVRPSTGVQYLANGFNGYVYKTDFNNVSVSRFNTVTGVYADTIRVNAFPTGIWTDQNRRIFVNSFAGMLSLIDYDDNGVHNEYSTDSPALGLGFDSVSTKLWWVDEEKLVRHDLSTKTQLETYVSGDMEDWHFSGDFPAGTPLNLTSTIQQEYENTSGTVTIKPYIFVAYTGGIGCFRLDTYLMYRPSFIEINGTGAVVAGSLQYFGEIAE